jgi:general secretion pathway protein L
MAKQRHALKQKKTLIILHSIDPVSASWCVFDTTNTIDAHGHGDLASLPTECKEYETIVLAPSEDTSILQAQLPKLKTHQLLQAVPYALEDALINDVSELHFALGKRQADNSVPVAVVAKAKITQWLAILDECGITPQQLLPGLLSLPPVIGHWQIKLSNGVAAVRTGDYKGFVCDANNLVTLLELQLTATLEPPVSLQVYGLIGDEIKSFPENINHVPVEKIVLTANLLLTKIIEASMQSPTINLLQNDYLKKSSGAISKKTWRWLGYAVLAWLVIMIISNLFEYIILQKQATRINQAINTIYYQNFPAATAVVAPRERMTAKLQRSGSALTHNDFLVLLAIIGHEIESNSTVQLQNLDFRNNQLSVTVTAPTAAAIDKLVLALNAQSIMAKEQNATVGTDTVTAVILLQRSAS